jgi:hypothetical protein
LLAAGWEGAGAGLAATGLGAGFGAGFETWVGAGDATTRWGALRTGAGAVRTGAAATIGRGAGATWWRVLRWWRAGWALRWWRRAGLARGLVGWVGGFVAT